MSIYTIAENKQFVVVATLDSLGNQAINAIRSALRSSRWDSHKAIDAKIGNDIRTTESGAVDIVLNQSAAKRIEDSIHYSRISRADAISIGARKVQEELAMHLGLDPKRPLRSAAKK